MPAKDMTPDPHVPERWAAVNERIVREQDAALSCQDRGFLYGDGLFETMKARGGRVDFLQRHLDRMRSGAKELGLPFPATEPLPDLIRELLARNRIRGPAAVKLCLSRGRHAGALTLYAPEEPTRVLTVRPWHPPSPSHWERGLSIQVETAFRQNARSGICHLKTLNYLPNLLVRTRAEAAGHEDAVLLNTRDQVCECTASNLFWFREGRLETPDLSCGLLPGVVRSVLLEMMAEAGTPVRPVRARMEALLNAQEVFVTNSLVEIFPVGRVGEDSFPQRERTRALAERFRAHRDALHPASG